MARYYKIDKDTRIRWGYSPYLFGKGYWLQKRKRFLGIPYWRGVAWTYHNDKHGFPIHDDFDDLKGYLLRKAERENEVPFF